MASVHRSLFEAIMGAIKGGIISTHVEGIETPLRDDVLASPCIFLF